MRDTTISSGDFDEYATLAALEAAFPSDGSGGVVRLVRPLADGTLVIKQAGGTRGVAGSQPGASKTLTVKAGVDEPCQAIGFVASGSSGCVPVKVYR